MGSREGRYQTERFYHPHHRESGGRGRSKWQELEQPEETAEADRMEESTEETDEEEIIEEEIEEMETAEEEPDDESFEESTELDEEEPDPELPEDADEKKNCQNPRKKPKRLHNAKQIEL